MEMVVSLVLCFQSFSFSNQLIPVVPVSKSVFIPKVCVKISVFNQYIFCALVKIMSTGLLDITQLNFRAVVKSYEKLRYAKTMQVVCFV